MGDIVIIFLIQNILVFSLIFWLLTFLAEYFYKKKTHLAKKQFYECGFRTLSELNIQVNINFSMLCVFLVLYDVEFTLLFPFLFKTGLISLYSMIFFLCFVFFIIVSLYYDWQFNALSWQY